MTEVTPAALVLICFMLLHGFITALNCTSPTPKSLYSELEKTLFSQNLVPPKGSFSVPVNVTTSITVVGILEVNEKAQTLTTVIWQVLEWDIEGLSWDEKECGTTSVSVPRERLWVPDVIITEFMDEEKSPSTPYIYLDNTGHVFDDKPIRLVTTCQLEIYTFPFDVQNCSLTFGSYLHTAKDIRMIQGSTSKEVLQESRDVLQTSGEWELTDIHIGEAALALDVGNYSEIKYYIILRRRPMVYVVNLLIPSCFLITVDLFSFLLPPQSVDRSAFKMTLILGYTVFLLIMNDLLPITGETTPLINVFFSFSLALMVTSLLETVFITNIQFTSNQYSEVPHWLSVLVLRYLAIVVCLPPKKKSNRKTVSLKPPSADHPQAISASTLADKPPLTPVTPPPSLEPGLNELRMLSKDLMAIRLQIDKHFTQNDSTQEWQMIGIVIDRLLFSLYIIFITASFLAIVAIWIWNSSY